MLTLDELLDDFSTFAKLPSGSPIGVNTRSLAGYTPLHWMAYLGDALAVKLLLDSGAAIDAADSEGNTPLHEAVGARQADDVRLLLERGAQDGVKNASGQTPREIAKSRGYTSLLEVLRDAS